MKLRPIYRFQDGGAAPSQQPADASQSGAAPSQGGAPQGGGGPEEQIAQMAMQIVSQLGPEASAMLAQMIMQVLEQSSGAAPQGEPVYAKKGGKLVMIGRKRQPTLKGSRISVFPFSYYINKINKNGCYKKITKRRIC